MIAVQVSRPCAFWAAGILLALMAGSFLLGAAVSAAYLSDVRAECSLHRAEIYRTQALAQDMVIQTHGVVMEFLCAARGICLTDPAKFGRGSETAFGP